MCDPISAIALAGSAISAGVSYMGQQETLSAQQQANDEWVAGQRQAAQEAAAKDEANRQKASAAEQATLAKVSPEAQQATQQKAQTDLNTQMLQGSPAAQDSNIALLGGDAGADAGVQQDMAQRVTAAARAAQGRIAALAGISSYGGGYGDMGSIANQNIATGNEAIKLASDMRQGDTSTLAVSQRIQPVQYAQGSNLAGSLAGSLAGIAGNAFGSKLKTG
jgi:hypothetical protein